MNSRFRIATLVAAGVIGLSLLGLLAKHPASAAGGPDAKEPKVNSLLTVKEVKIQTQTWPQTIEASGAILPWQEIVVSPETGGLQLTELLVDVGDKVKRGQLLARLSDASLLVDQKKQEAVVAQAQANLAQAVSDAKRAQVVEHSGALSMQRIEEYRISEATARASLASAQADLDSTRLKLTQTRIVAADDGVVSSKSGVLGSVVTAGTEIFRLVRQNKLEWRPELDSRQIAAVRSGMTAHVTLPNGEQITGKVRTTGPTLSTNTGRATVYVSLASNTGARAGQFASGRLDLAATSALTLPQSAIVMRDGRAYVFVIGNNDTVTGKPVITGRYRDDRVEIISGVSPDARIVESGGAFLTEGAHVTVLAADQRSSK